MNPVQLSDETRAIGKPKDWDDEVNGPCGMLSVSDQEFNGHNIMISAWKPTEDELELLNNGGFVYLGIYGTIHPVVFLAAHNDEPE